MAKTKLPKSVAGLKMPKRLRKSRALTGFLNNPIGREIIAAAIVAGAGAAASALGKRRPSVRQVGEAGEAALDAGVNTAVATKDGVQEAAGAIASLASNLARRFLPDDNARPDVALSAKPKRPKHRGTKRRKAKRRNPEVVAHA